MRVRFILRFLLILLVSILFSVSSRFFVTSDCWSLQWGKTDWIQFAPVIVFSKTDCPLVWKLVEYTFNNWTYLCKDVLAKEANKVSMQVKIGIRFHRAEITYFEINRLYAYVKQIQQADYMRRNLLLIKVQV